MLCRNTKGMPYGRFSPSDLSGSERVKGAPFSAEDARDAQLDSAGGFVTFANSRTQRSRVMNQPVIIIKLRSDTPFCAVVYLRKQGSGATRVYEAGASALHIIHIAVLIAADSSSRRSSRAAR